MNWVLIWEIYYHFRDVTVQFACSTNGEGTRQAALSLAPLLDVRTRLEKRRRADTRPHSMSRARQGGLGQRSSGTNDFPQVA